MISWRHCTDITVKKPGAASPLQFLIGGGLHGVAICSNPVARNADDGLTLEVSRVCTDGARNACSMLYGACARIAKDMGFHKIQTYILVSEPGTSLKASGWICEGECGRESWMKYASERTKARQSSKQLSLFPEKRPPEEMKVRYAKYFNCSHEELRED